MFDLDGTLRDNRPSSHQVFFDCAVDLGLEDSPSGRQKALRWAHAYWASSDDLLQDQTLFGHDPALFWRGYARRYLLAFGSDSQQAEALAPDVHRFMAESYEPEDHVPADVIPTLTHLQVSGYTLGVVSNRDDPFGLYLQELGLADFFSFCLSAGEAESWKPDPGIFHQALDQAGVTPDQALYVGDNYYADVVGARRAGILPVLIDPHDLFPTVDCPVIHSLGEILQLL